MNALMNFAQEADLVETEAYGARWHSTFEVATPSGLMYQSTFRIKYDIPESFWLGLRQCDEGRVVDLDKALRDPYDLP